MKINKIISAVDCKGLSELESVVKLLDEILCIRVFVPAWKNVDKEIMFTEKEALKVIAEMRKRNKDFPITLGIADYMREKGYIK
jgi:hypothetical protein